MPTGRKRKVEVDASSDGGPGEMLSHHLLKTLAGWIPIQVSRRVLAAKDKVARKIEPPLIVSAWRGAIIYGQNRRLITPYSYLFFLALMTPFFMIAIICIQKKKWEKQLPQQKYLSEKA